MLGKSTSGASCTGPRAAAAEHPMPQLIEALIEHADVSAIRSRDLTKVYYGLARLGWPGDAPMMPELLRSLASRCLGITHDLDPMGVASVLWSLSKLPASSLVSAQVASLQLAARKLVRSFNPQDVAQTLHAVARLCRGDNSPSPSAGGGSTGKGAAAAGKSSPCEADPALVTALVERAVMVREKFKPEELSSATGAAILLDVAPAHLDPLLARIAEDAHRFEPASLASVLHATARHRVVCPHVVAAVGDAAATQLERGIAAFGEQECATLAWSFAKHGQAHPRLFAALRTAVANDAAVFTEQGLANVAWALVSADPADPEVATKSEAAMNAVKTVTIRSACAGGLAPQNLFSLWHSIATAGQCDDGCTAALVAAATTVTARPELGLQDIAAALAAIAKDGKPHSALLRALEQRIGASDVGGASAQLRGSLLWGFAKCGHRPLAAVLDKLLDQTVAGESAEHGAKEVCNMLWSLAVLEAADSPTFEVLVKQLPGIVPEMNAQDASNVVSALARADYNADKSLRKLCGAAVTAHGPAMSPGALALAVWGLSKLGVSSSSLRAFLRDRVVGALPSMHAQNIGLLCHAAATGKLLSGVDVEKALLRRARVTLNEMNWQSVGHLHLFMAARPDLGSKFAKLAKRVSARVAVLMQEVRDSSQNHARAVAAAGVACLPDLMSRLPARGQALLIGRDTGAVRKALRKADFTVARWERFCSGSRVGSAWPKDTAAFAIVNLAAGLEWLEMDLLAAAASVPTGAPVYCYGHRDDRSMLTRCRIKLPAKFFTFGRQTEVTASTFWACLIRNDVSVGSFGTASGWKSKDTLELGGHSVPWTTWPGLFAGGGMDVMTAFLLQNLPVIADRARVLDFCAGSGTIAKSILLNAPTASVTLLDADALAVRAAKRNVADATTILSDGWEHLPKKARFDLIVSNPPVHRGRCQDFSVLEDLVTGALAHLRPNGQLIFVTQSYVPTALVGTVGAASSLKLVAYDGRFTVWRLGGGETVPQLSDRKRKRSAAASTKSHRKEKRKKRESNP